MTEAEKYAAGVTDAWVRRRGGWKLEIMGEAYGRFARALREFDRLAG